MKKVRQFVSFIIFMIFLSLAAHADTIDVGNPSLTFIKNEELSSTGVKYYEEENYDHIVFVLDLDDAKVVPLTPEMVDMNGNPSATCSLPTDLIGLDNMCLIPTQSINMFHDGVQGDSRLFAVVSGSFGQHSSASVHNDPLPFLYKRDGSVLFRGYEMGSGVEKRAVILGDKTVDIVTAPSDNSESAISSFLNSHPASHVVGGLEPNAPKSSNYRVGRNYWGINGAGELVILMTDHSKYVSDLSSGLTVYEAVDVMEAFDVDEADMVMFDGSGSVQAIVDGKKVLPGDGRLLTNTFAIYRAERDPGEFYDVHAGDWYYDYIKRLAESGIVVGYDDGKFKPNNQITRAEFVKIVVLASGSECNTITNPCNDDLPYGDVAVSDWYYDLVKAAYNKGWIVYDDQHTDFKPNDNINRAEAVRIISAALEQTNLNSTPASFFEDVQDSGVWYYEPVYICKNLNIVSGYAEGHDCDNNSAPGKVYFCPGNNITRGETAKVVVEAFKL